MSSSLSCFKEHSKMLQRVRQLRVAIGDESNAHSTGDQAGNMIHLDRILGEMFALEKKAADFTTDQKKEFQLLNSASAFAISYSFKHCGLSVLRNGLDLFIKILETGSDGSDD